MPVAHINNLDLYYEVHGEGPVLVFAHGVGGNHASWYQQIAYFSRWYQVVTFDHRGFGNSRDDPEGPGRAAFVDDLKGLLDHLGIERASLVAQSMGGGTCTVFTHRYPERVSALVLADTLAGMSLSGAAGSMMEEVSRTADGLSQLDRVVSQGYRLRNPAGTELYLQNTSFNMVRRSNLRGSLPPGPTPEELAALDIPILFLVGQEDVLFPSKAVRAVHDLVPGSSFVEVADAAHSVYWEQPDIFNHTIRRFLESAGVLGAQQEKQQTAVR